MELAQKTSRERHVGEFQMWSFLIYKDSLLFWNKCVTIHMEYCQLKEAPWRLWCPKLLKGCNCLLPVWLTFNLSPCSRFGLIPVVPSSSSGQIWYRTSQSPHRESHDWTSWRPDLPGKQRQCFPARHLGPGDHLPVAEDKVQSSLWGRFIPHYPGSMAIRGAATFRGTQEPGRVGCWLLDCAPCSISWSAGSSTGLFTL